MDDLKKLTAQELRLLFNANRPTLGLRAFEILEEIERRLGRLERCEAFADKYADHLATCACRISLANTCDCGFIGADAARAAAEE